MSTGSPPSLIDLVFIRYMDGSTDGLMDAIDTIARAINFRKDSARV